MGKFVINQNDKGGFSFSLKANNGEIIATSQVYRSLPTCKKGISSVVKNAPIAGLEDQTKEGYERQKHPKFEMYTDKAGATRFRLKALNGQIIVVGQGYKSPSGCLNGIDSIRRHAAEAEIVLPQSEE